MASALPPDPAIAQLENQIAHLQRSTEELERILREGQDDGVPISDMDRATFADAVAENREALSTKAARLRELRRAAGLDPGGNGAD